MALVTGAARRIGASIATALHARNCRLLLHYRSSEGEAAALAEKFNALRPGSAALLCADLSNDDGPEKLAEQVRAHCSRLDLMVNNARTGERTISTDVGGLHVAGGLRLYFWEQR